MSPTTCCTACGKTPSSERPAITWSMAVERGRRSWTCSPCVRGQLSMIECGVLASVA